MQHTLVTFVDIQEIMKWELSGDALLSRYMGKKGRADCRHVLLAERKHGGVDLGPGETLGSASLYDLNNYKHT